MLQKSSAAVVMAFLGLTTFYLRTKREVFEILEHLKTTISGTLKASMKACLPCLKN